MYFLKKYFRRPIVIIIYSLVVLGCTSGSCAKKRVETHNSEIKIENKIVKKEKEKSNDTQVIPSLNIFLHDNNSIKGFKFLGSQFGDDVHHFFNDLADPQNRKVSNTNVFKIKINKEVAKTQVGNGLNALADYTKNENKTDGLNTNSGKSNDIDFSKIFDSIIRESINNPNSISAFISDLVYYPGEEPGINLSAYLNGQKERIRTVFSSALGKQPDFCLFILKGVSNYKWDNTVAKNRPYYVIFCGRKSNLRSIMGFASQKWKGNKFWFELIKSTKIPRVEVVRGHQWIEGSYDTKHDNPNLILEPNLRTRTKQFAFVSEVDLSDFSGLEHLVADKQNYSNGEWRVLFIGKQPGYKSQIQNGYQFKIGTLSNLNPKHIEIKLPYPRPHWTTNSSFRDYPSGNITEPKYENRTFGFHDLISGIIDAYHIGEKEIINLKFKIEQ